VETLLLSHVGFQTLIATKAARVVGAADGRAVVDFGSRRAHGPQAAALAARACYVGGCAGSSNLLAGRELGIPVFGTAAHSWTMSWPSEEEAFRRYVGVFGEASTLLVDTYDTLRGVRRAAQAGGALKAIRLDSGDLLGLSREARAILDGAGRTSTRIIASGDLDEHRIAELVRAGAPIDSFGVGTRMVTSHDGPALGVVYKLVEVAGRPAAKSSEGKATLAGAKQVFRFRDDEGRHLRDAVARADESLDGEALLVPYVTRGRLARGYPPLEEIRRRAEKEIAALPPEVRRLRDPAPFPVEPTRALAGQNARAAGETEGG
jgi:nicotinate phosphoribosyltransferase